MLEGNRLLGALSETDQGWIDKHVDQIELRMGDTLYEPGDMVDHVYFPCGGAMASFMVLMEDGRAVETALIGCEGAIGGIVSGGDLPAFSRSTVVNGGKFLRLAGERLEELKAAAPAIDRLFNRYADCLLAQIFQSAACNATHLLEQRAAKWIVASVERSGVHSVDITQEQLANILGVGRSYASRVMQRFKAAGALATRRGGLTILDIEKLRAESCRCNDVVRSHFDEVLAGVYPQRAD